MNRLSHDREALDFISSRIADEAQREGVPLSEVERKMLYFSETAWTLPDILEVSDEFDRDYKQDVYEKKISQLIKKAVANARKHQREEFEGWTEAIRRLSTEDRFLLVMIRQANLGTTFQLGGVSGRFWGIALLGMTFFASLVWIMAKIFPDSSTSVYPRSGSGPYGFAIWITMVCVALAFSALRLFLRARKLGNVESRVLEWIFGLPKRRK